VRSCNAPHLSLLPLSFNGAVAERRAEGSFRHSLPTTHLASGDPGFRLTLFAAAPYNPSAVHDFFPGSNSCA
jgi:hypothetical protein